MFTGTVVFTDHDPKQGLRQRTLVKFRVDEAFKGLAPTDKEVWVDPGSFTSCYAEYNVGEHLLVFAYEKRGMPSDSSLMSVVPGQATPKPLPVDFERNKPLVYSAPECSGTRLTEANASGRNQDLIYLREGKVSPSIRGRVTEDEGFGIFINDPVPGLARVTVTASSNGLKRTTNTDESGFYSFEEVAVGNYVLEPLLKPYTASGWKTREVSVPAVGCGSANFDLIGHGRIEGTLLDSQQKLAPHVRVEVLRLNTEGKPIYYAEKETTTDSGGHYQFSQLPSGNFQIGVNVFEGPDAKMPYPPTKWSSGTTSSIHLEAGEAKSIPPFQLPLRRPVRKIDAVVRWPDGRPAQGATVWADFGERGGASGEVNADGVAHIEVLEALTYAVEAKIWTDGKREVARSGVLKLTPGKQPIHLDLVLNQRSEGWR